MVTARRRRVTCRIREGVEIGLFGDVLWCVELGDKIRRLGWDLSHVLRRSAGAGHQGQVGEKKVERQQVFAPDYGNAEIRQRNPAAARDFSEPPMPPTGAICVSAKRAAKV